MLHTHPSENYISPITAPRRLNTNVKASHMYCNRETSLQICPGSCSSRSFQIYLTIRSIRASSEVPTGTDAVSPFPNHFYVRQLRIRQEKTRIPRVMRPRQSKRRRNYLCSSTNNGHASVHVCLPLKVTSTISYNSNCTFCKNPRATSIL